MMRPMMMVAALLGAGVMATGCSGGVCGKLVEFELECGDLKGAPDSAKSAMIDMCNAAPDSAKKEDPSFACAEEAKDCAAFKKCKKDKRAAKEVDEIKKQIADGKASDAFQTCSFQADDGGLADAAKGPCLEAAAKHVAEKSKDDSGSYEVRTTCELEWVRADANAGKACDEAFKKILDAAVKADRVISATSDCEGVKHKANKAVCATFAKEQFAAFGKKVTDIRDGKANNDKRISICSDYEKFGKLVGGDSVKSAKALCEEADVGGDLKEALDKVGDELKKEKKKLPWKCGSVMDDLVKLPESAWTKTAKKKLADECVVKLGVAIITAELPGIKSVCPLNVENVMGAASKYKVADANLTKLITDATGKGCKAR